MAFSPVELEPNLHLPGGADTCKHLESEQNISGRLKDAAESHIQGSAALSGNWTDFCFILFSETFICPSRALLSNKGLKTHRSQTFKFTADAIIKDLTVCSSSSCGVWTLVVMAIQRHHTVLGRCFHGAQQGAAIINDLLEVKGQNKIRRTQNDAKSRYDSHKDTEKLTLLQGQTALAINKANSGVSVGQRQRRCVKLTPSLAELKLAYYDGHRASMASDGQSRENRAGDGDADLQDQEDHQDAQRSVF